MPIPQTPIATDCRNVVETQSSDSGNLNREAGGAPSDFAGVSFAEMEKELGGIVYATDDWGGLKRGPAAK